MAVKENTPLLPDKTKGSSSSYDSLSLAAVEAFPIPESELVRASSTSSPTSSVILTNDSISLQSEFKLVLANGLPLCVTFFTQYMLSVIPLLMTGHLSTADLGASSLAIMFMNITYLGVIEGTATAVDSFAPQAFGSNNLHLVGYAVQKNAVIMAIMLTPMVILCYYSAVILGALQPNQEIAQLAQLFTRVTSLGVPGLALFQLMQRFLQAQNIFDATTYVTLITCPLNLLTSYLLVFYFDFGFIGAPVTMALSYWFMAFLLFMYIIFIDGKQCWGGLDRTHMFTNIAPMLQLTFAGILMVESEYFAFEVMTLLASYFGEESLAGQSICSSIGSLLYQIPFALSSAISTRIGQLIGAGAKHSAIRSSHFFMMSMVFLGILECVLLLIFKKPIIYLFSNDPEVVRISSKVLPILFVTQCYDFLNVTCAGIFRSQSRLTIGSVLNFCGYYFMGLPLAYIFAFKLNYGLIGLWLGLTISVFFLTAIETIIILKSNWDKIIHDSKVRTG